MDVEKRSGHTLVSHHKLKHLIGDKRQMRELLEDKLGLYLPTSKGCTLFFMKQILGGEKDALQRDKLCELVNLPKEPNLGVKEVYEKALADPKLLKYLPHYPKSVLP